MENIPQEGNFNQKEIEYPYLPEGREIKYVPADNQFMLVAKAYAREHSLDHMMPGAAVVVNQNEVIGLGANGSDYHTTNGCERVKLGCKSGEGYNLCEGCHPKNHSERRAIEAVRQAGIDPRGSDLYLWGHWWCCKDCWDAMNEAGIKDVYLMSDSEKLFDRNNPNNIVGEQFKS